MARNKPASWFGLPNALRGVWGPFHPRRLTIALLSMACVLSLTHIPQAALPRALQHTLFDKFEHFAAYGAVALLFVFSLRRPLRSWLLLGVLLALALIGAVDEITQPFVNRQASIEDYAADVVGIAFASVFALFRRLHRIRVEEQSSLARSHGRD
jgi:VanZ family protein